MTLKTRDGRSLPVEVTRRNRRSVSLTIDGRPHLINRWGVLCRVSTLDDGRKWYGFSGLDVPARAVAALVDSFNVGRDWNGAEYQHAFRNEVER